MKIEENVSLKKYNTFGINISAKFFSSLTHKNDLFDLIASEVFKRNKKLILGGGSNILFTGDYNGLVIKNDIKGINIINENDEYVWVCSGAGEVWDDLVNYCIKNKYGGIENLSLIPGTVGAAPIQNIGAYGVELKDVFESLSGVFLESGNEKEFKLNDCEFGYRKSIFKSDLKDRFTITDVVLKLKKNPELNLSYSSLKNEIRKLDEKNINIRRVSEIVKSIRRSKLPDPLNLGNAGSFFKNPEVDKGKLEEIKYQNNDVVFFEIDKSTYKIPAGWLIEKCGLKGFKKGRTGTYDKQALVIVNYNNASGKEISEFSDYILDQVYQKFQIKLEKEVNII